MNDERDDARDPRSGSRTVKGYVKAVLALEAVRKKRLSCARSIAGATSWRPMSRRGSGR